MKIRSILLSLSFIMVWNFTMGQNNINEYKYIIVQRQYEFQRSMDSYQVNSLFKFLFERAGFTTFYTDERVPDDLMNNPCLALNAVLKNHSSFLRIKMNIELRDCRNAVVFSTSEAVTKEKDYKKAYHEVIRASFVDIEALNYAYQPKSKEDKQITAAKVTEEVVIEEPKKEIVPPIEEKSSVAKKEVKEVTAIKPEKKEPIKKVALVEKEIAEPKKIKAEKQLKEEVQVPPPPPKKVKPTKVQKLTGSFNSDKWGICEIVEDNGNYTMKVGNERADFAAIYKTSKPNIYIVKWVAYKKPQLVLITPEGNLQIDSDKGFELYVRVD